MINRFLLAGRLVEEPVSRYWDIFETFLLLIVHFNKLIYILLYVMKGENNGFGFRRDSYTMGSFNPKFLSI